MPSWLTACVTIGFLLVNTGPLAAQEPLTYKYSVRPGDTLFVTDDTGTETRGRVVAVEPSALRLMVNGVEREWSAASIQRLERRGDSVKNGTIAGLVTGGAFGTFVLVAAAPYVRDRELLILLAFMGTGTAIGAGTDALIPGRTLIYRQPARGVTLAPVVGSTAQAVQLRVSF